MNPIIYTAFIIVVSALISFGLEEFLFRTANRKNILDNPGGRRLHKGAIPRVAGWAFFVVFAFMTLLIIPTFHQYEAREIRELLPFLFGTGCLFIVGVIDDVEELGSKIKMIFQLIAAFPIVVKFSGFSLLNFHFLDIIEMGILMFIIVWVINSINLIDGIDGLSGSIGLLVMSTAVFLLNSTTHFLAYLVCLSLAVSLVVFLFYNMSSGKSKRKMFMGDAGSLVMGYIISIVLFHGWYRDVCESQYLFPIAMGICIVPMFDVIMVSVTRYVEGRNPFKADLSHLHHKFLYCGLTARRSLIYIVGICITLAAINTLLCEKGYVSYCIIDLVVLSVMYVTLWYNKRKLSKQIKRHWDRNTGMYVEDLEK